MSYDPRTSVNRLVQLSEDNAALRLRVRALEDCLRRCYPRALKADYELARRILNEDQPSKP